jgi:hypothetical protein
MYTPIKKASATPITTHTTAASEDSKGIASQHVRLFTSVIEKTKQEVAQRTTRITELSAQLLDISSKNEELNVGKKNEIERALREI